MYRIKVPGPDGALREVRTDKGEQLFGSTSSMGLEIKSLDTKEKSFWAVASTEAIDREGDILEVKGWELENYLKNPIGLWSHDSWGVPIFKSLETKTVKKELLFKPKFADDDFSTHVFNLYAERFMRAFSVGFRFLVWEWIREINDEGIARVTGRRGKRMELFEISAVNVGANPEALAKIKAVGGVINEYEDSPERVHKGFYLLETEHAKEGIKDPVLVDIGGGVFKEVVPEEDGLVLGFRFSEDSWNPELVKTWATHFPNHREANGAKLIIPWEKGGVTVPVKPKKIEKEEKTDEQKKVEAFVQAKAKLDEAIKLMQDATNILAENGVEPEEKTIDEKLAEITAGVSHMLEEALGKVAEEISSLKAAVATKGDPPPDDPEDETKGLNKDEFASVAKETLGQTFKSFSEDLKKTVDAALGKLT